jgi:two-component system sensor histidine kinase/response regulator
MAVLRALVAEDNGVNQRLTLPLLEKQGHQFTLTTNGRQVNEALANQTFDLVWMDVQMPEMDGFEAPAAIRHRERDNGTPLPIIVVTAHVIKGDRERYLIGGMDGCLSKPTWPEELDALLEYHVPRTGPMQVPEPAEQGK